MNEQAIILPGSPEALALIEAARREIVKVDRHRTGCYAARKSPLLRGALVGGMNWTQVSGHPLVEYGWCSIEVWCPYCGDTHSHGWSPAFDGRWAEHRGAHCWKDSPFRSGGYWISPWRKSDSAFTSHVYKPGEAILRLLPAFKQRKAAQ